MNEVKQISRIGNARSINDINGLEDDTFQNAQQEMIDQ